MADTPQLARFLLPDLSSDPPRHAVRDSSPLLRRPPPPFSSPFFSFLQAPSGRRVAGAWAASGLRADQRNRRYRLRRGCGRSACREVHGMVELFPISVFELLWVWLFFVFSGLIFCEVVFDCCKRFLEVLLLCSFSMFGKGYWPKGNAFGKLCRGSFLFGFCCLRKNVRLYIG